jgi:ComF family protein
MIWQTLKKHLESSLDLIFPQNCLTCNQILENSEQQICTECRYHLPETNDFKIQNNALYQKLSVYFPIEFASSYLFFTKKGKVQKMLHALKYHNNPEIGQYLGRWYGQVLYENGFQNKFDMIIPVPLHTKKLKIRGYNQSAEFGKGLAEILQIHQLENILVRQKNTITQTQKAKMERWENVSKVFAITNPKEIENKKILVVDDVITTGATMGECLHVLNECKPLNLSVISIAIAQE